MAKAKNNNTTAADLARMTDYVRVHGPNVAAARKGMAQFATEVLAMIATLRALILSGEREALTTAQYNAVREDWASPLGYVAPSAPRGARGTDEYRAHTSRDVYYSKTLFLTRLSPDAKIAAGADAKFSEVSNGKAKVEKGKARKARPAAGSTVRISALVAAAIERAKARGISNAVMAEAIDALTK